MTQMPIRTGAREGSKNEESTLLCLIPAELSGKLLEPLRRHYREAGVEIEVLEERRSRERRSGKERRKKDNGPPKGTPERRLIHNPDGRRLGERRAELLPTEPPLELPRRGRQHADRISFYRRLPISEERAEDLDTGRLVTRIQAADGQEAFAELYSRYFDRVYAYMRVALRDPHGAEDAAQQVFMQVFEKLAAYERRDRPFRAWLFTVARNTALMELRKRGKLDFQDPADLDRVREGGTGEDGIEVLEWISDSDLMLFVDRLPLPQRQALLLRYMLGMSAGEIAEILDRSPNDVSQLQSRALRFLRERLVAIGRRGPHGERIRTRRRVIQAWVIRSRRYALHH